MWLDVCSSQLSQHHQLEDVETCGGRKRKHCGSLRARSRAHLNAFGEVGGHLAGRVTEQSGKRLEKTGLARGFGIEISKIFILEQQFG